MSSSSDFISCLDTAFPPHPDTTRQAQQLIAKHQNSVLSDDSFVISICRLIRNKPHLLNSFTTSSAVPTGYRVEWSAFGSDKAPDAIAIFKHEKSCTIYRLVDSPDSRLTRLSSEELHYAICNGRTFEFGDIRSLSPSDASSFMMLVQFALDTLSWDFDHRRRCHSMMRKLIKLHNVLPPSFYIDIVTDSEHPMDGGGYADIYLGSVKGQPVCLKVLKIYLHSSDRERRQVVRSFCNEAFIWRQLKHPNILPFLGVNEARFPTRFCLISPYMKNGNINSYLKSHPDHDRFSSICEIARGMEYLHRVGICHGDIKGANILVDDNLNCRLADFGITGIVESQSESISFSSTVSTKATGVRGSVRWLAPEVLEGELKTLSEPRDVYAFACTVIEVTTGQVPFPEDRLDAPVLINVVNGKRPPRPNNSCVTESLWMLVQKCWSQEPCHRPSARDIITSLTSPQSESCEHAQPGSSRLLPSVPALSIPAEPLLDEAPPPYTPHPPIVNVAVLITTDAVNYTWTDLTGIMDGQHLRELLLRKARVGDESTAVIYRAGPGFGTMVTPSEQPLSNRDLDALCREEGDQNGTLKFFILSNPSRNNYNHHQRGPSSPVPFPSSARAQPQSSATGTSSGAGASLVEAAPAAHRPTLSLPTSSLPSSSPDCNGGSSSPNSTPVSARPSRPLPRPPRRSEAEPAPHPASTLPPPEISDQDIRRIVGAEERVPTRPQEPDVELPDVVISPTDDRPPPTQRPSLFPSPPPSPTRVDEGMAVSQAEAQEMLHASTSNAHAGLTTRATGDEPVSGRKEQAPPASSQSMLHSTRSVLAGDPTRPSTTSLSAAPTPHTLRAFKSMSHLAVAKGDSPSRSHSAKADNNHRSRPKVPTPSIAIETSALALRPSSSRLPFEPHGHQAKSPGTPLESPLSPSAHRKVSPTVSRGRAADGNFFRRLPSPLVMAGRALPPSPSPQPSEPRLSPTKKHKATKQRPTLNTQLGTPSLRTRQRAPSASPSTRIPAPPYSAHEAPRSTTWVSRPPLESVCENMERHFPAHDVDEQLLPSDSPGSSPVDSAPPSASSASMDNEARRHSLRAVARKRISSDRRSSTSETLEVDTDVQEFTTERLKMERKLAQPKRSTFKGCWCRGEVIGQGAYAKVYLGMNMATGVMMAVKEVELPQTASDANNQTQAAVVDALTQESHTLKNLDHPNIVHYFGYQRTPLTLAIFLEYVPGGSIGSCLRKFGKFEDNTTKSFTSQILSGLEYLHAKKIIHRDVKSDNILLEETGLCKISDFGVSKRIESEAHTNLQGSVYWMAPEVIRSTVEKGYDVKADIWSVGCVVFEMWFGQSPWAGLHRAMVLTKMYAEAVSPPLPEGARLSAVAEDFRKQCFAPNPQKRASAAALQKHQYLRLPVGWTFPGLATHFAGRSVLDMYLAPNVVERQPSGQGGKWVKANRWKDLAVPEGLVPEYAMGYSNENFILNEPIDADRTETVYRCMS